MPDAIRLARSTFTTIRRNLGWAFCYNLAALPLAAAGLLNPLIAAVTMTLSSTFVVANSLRLRRFQAGALPGGRQMTTTTTTYVVTGMTCEHCVRAVTSELRGLAGVAGVAVELVPGGESRLTVTSAGQLPEAAVTAALDEAGGYALAGP